MEIDLTHAIKAEFAWKDTGNKIDFAEGISVTVKGLSQTMTIRSITVTAELLDVTALGSPPAYILGEQRIIAHLVKEEPK